MSWTTRLYTRQTVTHAMTMKQSSCLVLFFFQAADGIRAPLVTGVQTCALPIFERRASDGVDRTADASAERDQAAAGRARSEERRVGKDCRNGRRRHHLRRRIPIPLTLSAPRGRRRGTRTSRSYYCSVPWRRVAA